MTFTVEEFNAWYTDLEDRGRYSSGPEFKLPQDDKSPFGDIEVGVDQGRELDYPSSYYYIIKVGDRFLRMTGYYDSQDGVDWDNYAGWSEVIKKTRTIEYWDTP